MERDRSPDMAITGEPGRFPGSPELAEWWMSLTTERVFTKRDDRQQPLDAGVAEGRAVDPAVVPGYGQLPEARGAVTPSPRTNP